MSAAAAAAGGFPKWVLLEPFVFRRDDEHSFPDESSAPIRASGTSSWGAHFRVAFSVADPPRISRLYAHLPQPGFPDPMKSNPLGIVATHRHAALLRVGTQTPELLALQDLFILRADQSNPSSSSLKALPPCREPDFDYTRDDGRLPRRRRRRHTPSDDAPPRLLDVRLLGLWCPSGGEEDEFVVAELSLYKPISSSKVFADIYLLREREDHQLGGGGAAWSSMRVLILSTDNPDDEDLWRLCCWETETVIAFQRWLCWIDYHQGILFCDMEVPTPTVSFLRFPLHKSPPPPTSTHSDSDSDTDGDADTDTDTCGFFYHGASVVDHGRVLKFVGVTRHDGIPFGALKPGTGFTITCHTLVLGSGGGISSSMEWKEDYTVTSRELWDANPPDRLPRDIPMFPQVDIDRTHVVHFLFMEFGYAKKKMWTVSIDMSTKIVESFSPCINGNEGLQTDDADLIVYKSMTPMPFLPCEFPRFCRLSRKRKDME
ncbi:unnamed protein product [Urochloa humidicola]